MSTSPIMESNTLAKTTAPDLFRDLRNNSILCTDISRWAAYRAAREQTKAIGNLEAQIIELKTLLNNKDK